MRTFLLDSIDFTKFPPVNRYFKGIPSVTFEGMLIDTDSKIQLHGLTNTYNIRAVGKPGGRNNRWSSAITVSNFSCVDKSM